MRSHAGAWERSKMPEAKLRLMTWGTSVRLTALFRVIGCAESTLSLSKGRRCINRVTQMMRFVPQRILCWLSASLGSALRPYDFTALLRRELASQANKPLKNNQMEAGAGTVFA